MGDVATARGVGEHRAVVATVRAGSESEFAALVEPHRRELRVHCYRMLGNFEDAEDVVQETFVKAWRSRAGFEGRSTLRAWLYRIATNACLDAIKRRRRRVTISTPSRPPTLDEVPWLQPIPDDLLEVTGPGEAEPEAVLVAKETIELAFLAAIQYLPPRPRAVLILRDVLGWSARETAEALDGTVAAVNSALQRARARLQDLGRPDRRRCAPLAPPSDEERELLQRYMEAHARADPAAVVELLSEDVMFTMPTVLDDLVQEQTRFDGRQAVAAFFQQLLSPDGPGDWRLVPIRANGQPATANYLRRWGDVTYRAVTLDVLRIEHGVVIEITTFDDSMFTVFGLPSTL